MARMLLYAPTLHYVDDYGGIEPAASASSACDGFEGGNAAFAFTMKASKRQPPAASHRIQGVFISITLDEVILSPCPQRVAHVVEMIDRALGSNTLIRIHIPHPFRAARQGGEPLHSRATVLGGAQHQADDCAPFSTARTT